MINNRKVALILAGCGFLDGTEITEAVSLNIVLQQKGFSPVFFAPDRPQADTINHRQQMPQTDERNILVESARIARGQIQSLAKLYTTEYDAIVLAGGFGAVKNFTDFLTKGPNALLLPDIAKVLKEALAQKKPIVGICAAPLLLAMAVKEFGQTGQQITFGTRAQSMNFLNILDNWGVEHIEKPIDQCHIDTKYRLVTAAAYMYENASAAEVFSSIQAAVDGLNNLLK